METLIVIRHSETGFTGEAMQDLLALLDGCPGRKSIRWRRTFLSLDGRHMVCEFAGPDAEGLRLCFRSCGIAFTGIWTARVSHESETTLTERKSHGLPGQDLE